jgi:hypothetical protein
LLRPGSPDANVVLFLNYFGYTNTTSRKHDYMKLHSLSALTILLPAPSLAFNSLPKQKREVIRLPLVTPPDEEKIRELNGLASQYPFCILYKAKKYEML